MSVQKWGVPFVGVLVIRALVFGVCIEAPNFCKLPNMRGDLGPFRGAWLVVLATISVYDQRRTLKALLGSSDHRP